MCWLEHALYATIVRRLLISHMDMRFIALIDKHLLSAPCTCATSSSFPTAYHVLSAPSADALLHCNFNIYHVSSQLQEATKSQIDQMNGNCAVCWSPMVPAGEVSAQSTASSSSSCEEEEEQEVPSAAAPVAQGQQPQVCVSTHRKATFQRPTAEALAEAPQCHIIAHHSF